VGVIPDWMLAAPRLQMISDRPFVVFAVFRQDALRTRCVGHLEIRLNKHLWLGTLCGDVVADPAQDPPEYLTHAAQQALQDWLAWRRNT
jgi:hypothetical protein